MSNDASMTAKGLDIDSTENRGKVEPICPFLIQLPQVIEIQVHESPVMFGGADPNGLLSSK